MKNNPLKGVYPTGRLTQDPNNVPFQEILPLKLKNQVSGKGEKSSDVACLHELSILFACLKENEFNQTICNKEINNVQTCYKNFLDHKRIKKEQDKKGIITTGQRNLSHKQLNRFLKKFPTS